MVRLSKTIVIATCLMLLVAGAFAASDWLKGTPEEKLKTLAELQPGLGTVMIEYGNRYSIAYYAAKAGNWDLAAYQIKECREIQEVGETTRPGRAPGLKAFESAFLDPIDAAIKAKDLKKFDAAFKAGVAGCNACHASEGFAYIHYQLPSAPPSPLSMSGK